MSISSAGSYEEGLRRFAWEIPANFNIAIDVCDRWAALKPNAPAIITDKDDGVVEVMTFAELRDSSNKLANAMRSLGVHRGDRVAILLPQAALTAVSHMAIYKLGAIAVPLSSRLCESDCQA